MLFRTDRRSEIRIMSCRPCPILRRRSKFSIPKSKIMSCYAISLVFIHMFLTSLQVSRHLTSISKDRDRGLLCWCVRTNGKQFTVLCLICYESKSNWDLLTNWVTYYSVTGQMRIPFSRLWSCLYTVSEADFELLLVAFLQSDTCC